MGAAALAAVALLLFPSRALTVRGARDGDLIWAAPVRAGEEFRLTWIHTVTRRPVTETYAVTAGGRLRLVEMVFDQFGANLPHRPEGGTTWRIERDRIVVTGYDTVLDRLYLGVAPYGHWLQVGGREWDLLAGAGADRSVRLAAERLPFIRILVTEVWQWRNTRPLRGTPKRS
ncbi:hypothetical protein caldi_27130 [Caldinitratiruptor microaerophilus]|uniref:DUF1850 domain-containing protein n=1 Tax=Caldinitratiruptor microaerophilus TaxID=671077 RepID=A0AA35G9M3_9FIRM|nr:hypothetical protein caldi_27130 [Caldinitratiruptor microaerophilus]